MIAGGNAELHIHLEGSLSATTAIELAALRGHPWQSLTPAQLSRLFRYRNFNDFLGVIREMCTILCAPEALERAARELAQFLGRSRVEYAEVYCSPYVYMRWAVPYSETIDALDRGFARGEKEGGAVCSILLDSVRQWGPEAAMTLLGEHAKKRVSRVVGFGLGGDETTPLTEFTGVYRDARSLGLRTIAHAGEVGPASDVRIAISELEVDRIAHGIRAVDDPSIVELANQRGVTFDLALVSNYRTRAVVGAHPVRRLLDLGAKVTLSTDDPSLFRTTLGKEFAVARRCGGVSESEMGQIALNAIDSSFAPDAVKERLRESLGRRVAKDE